ncbi:MAG: hypothetical protein QXF56_02780 [Candidatus Micrarchaeia archaeon]
MEHWFLLASFAFLGAGLKYIDCVYDEGVFDRRVAVVLGLVCGVVMGYMIGSDIQASSIFLAVIMGVAITRKIDTNPFFIGAILAFAVPLFLTRNIVINWLPTAALVFGAIVDEVGNNRADLGLINSKTLKTFFHYRVSMEVVMLLLVLGGMFEPIYFAAFMFFDLAYHIVGGYANRLIRAQYEFLMIDTPDEIIVRQIEVRAGENGIWRMDD